MKYFVGIDPGSSQSGPGAIAVIDEENNIHELIDWPKEGLYLMVDHVKSIKINYSIAMVALEKVGSAPGQGLVSTCTFCGNAGEWRAMIHMAEFPFVEVTPKDWQRKVYDYRKRGEDPKIVSMRHAKKRFPSADLKFKKYHGRADALNIALYAKYVFNNR